MKKEDIEKFINQQVTVVAHGKTHFGAANSIIGDSTLELIVIVQRYQSWATEPVKIALDSIESIKPLSS